MEHVDVVVIGGGPAGMAAALEADRAGASVIVMDERPRLGGQIFKRFGAGFEVVDADRAGAEYNDGQSMIDAVARSDVSVRAGTVVWGIWGTRVAFVSGSDESGSIDAGRIILAGGARDRPVAFPGWTLPGVLTAGAAKSLVATQLVLPGRRILMAGSGPLALAFAAQLRGYGANVIEVLEAAPRPRLRVLAELAMNADPALLIEAARYRARLLRDRVPFRYSTIIVRAEGETEVESAVVADVDPDWHVIPGTERTVEVDTILLGYGLESSTELARLCGCQLRYDRGLGDWVPVRDEWLRTSVAEVFSVGDGSGVAGAPTAIVEGRLAGIAAAVDLGRLSAEDAAERMRKSRRRLGRLRRFGRSMSQLFPVGRGVHELATDDTVVCRCEEVTSSRLATAIADGVDDTNVMRAQTRAGMGRCQGRNCASHIAAMIARGTGRDIADVELPSIRPPVKPVPVGVIASEREHHEAQADLD